MKFLHRIFLNEWEYFFHNNLGIRFQIIVKNNQYWFTLDISVKQIINFIMKIVIRMIHPSKSLFLCKNLKIFWEKLILGSYSSMVSVSENIIKKGNYWFKRVTNDLNCRWILKNYPCQTDVAKGSIWTTSLGWRIKPTTYSPENSM